MPELRQALSFRAESQTESWQLKLILGFAKQEGLTQVIVACDKDNIASAKTAIGCGGISVKEFEEDGVMKQHYLIELKGI